MNRATPSIWRWMLGAAAAFNLVVALPALFAAAASADQRIAALLVGCFGLVYALVAWQPARLAPVLWAGIAGKAGIIALVLPEVLAGRAAPGTGAVLSGDAVFAALFLLFLLGPARLTGR